MGFLSKIYKKEYKSQYCIRTILGIKITTKLNNKDNQTDNNEKYINYNNKIENAICKTVELTSLWNNIDMKKKIFKENVDSIEIGIFSYCNRKCWFCSNIIVDRQSKNIILEENLFLKLLKELKEIDYDKTICLHRYNEPLYDMDILLLRMKQIKEYLPKVKISIYTNGDYLTLDKLDLLNGYVDNIYITYYYNYAGKEIKFDIENVIKPGMQKLLDKLKLDYKLIYQDSANYFLELKYDGIYVEYRSIDYTRIGTDRGGTIKDIEIHDRIAQCFLPNFQLVMDYDGNFTPCCHIRSDIDKHKPYILGNIKDNTIYDIFSNEKIVNLRKELLLQNKKKGVCATCSESRKWVNIF